MRPSGPRRPSPLRRFTGRRSRALRRAKASTTPRSEVIEPAFLASLRRRHRAELVLVLVQVEQLCPGWWADLSVLAEQLGTDRASLNRSLTKLERLGLLRRSRISNTGGNWVWWVKRREGDKPRGDDELGWRLFDIKTQTSLAVAVSKRWEWAARREINKNTFGAFLNGHQHVLLGRWRVTATPWDMTDCYDPAE